MSNTKIFLNFCVTAYHNKYRFELVVYGSQGKSVPGVTNHARTQECAQAAAEGPEGWPSPTREGNPGDLNARPLSTDNGILLKHRRSSGSRGRLRGRSRAVMTINIFTN
jgi:hypothetical protein